jgi:hypothetical protein
MSDIAPPRETGLERPVDANTWLDALTRGIAQRVRHARASKRPLAQRIDPRQTATHETNGNVE